jgi:hypothetical protein
LGLGGEEEEREESAKGEEEGEQKAKGAKQGCKAAFLFPISLTSFFPPPFLSVGTDSKISRKYRLSPIW